MDGSGKVFVS